MPGKKRPDQVKRKKSAKRWGNADLRAAALSTSSVSFSYYQVNKRNLKYAVVPAKHKMKLARI